MSFLSNWWNSIVQSDNQEIIDKYEPKLKAYQQQIDVQNEQITELSNNYKNASATIQTLNTERTKLLAQIKELTTKPIEPVVTAPNIFLNDNSAVVPYFGSWNVYGFKNNLPVVKRIKMTPKKFYSIWDDGFYQDVKLQCEGYDPITQWYDLGLHIYDWTMGLGIEYINDLSFSNTGKAIMGENFRIVPEIYYGLWDDCDRTPLFIVACRIAGIPADKVFHLTGTYNKLGEEIGHSFGGLYNYQNEMMILEMTQKRTPKKMIGSDYRCKGILSGITNWVFYGQPKQEQF